MFNIPSEIGNAISGAAQAAMNWVNPETDPKETANTDIPAESPQQENHLHNEQGTNAPSPWDLVNQANNVTTGNLSDAIQQAKQWLNEPQTEVNTNSGANKSAPSENTPNVDSEPATSDVNKSNGTQEVRRGLTVTEELELMRLECLPAIEEKVKAITGKIEAKRAALGCIDDLLNKFENARTEEGGVDYTQSKELQELFEKARQLEVDVPQKTVLSKDECDSLIRTLNNKREQFELDIKLFMQESQKLIQQRDAFWQEIKSAWDSIRSVVSRIIHNINSRSSS